ncbi:putative nephrin isoform X2 [Penaeus vannamei]|uniref:Putative nephrin isoform X2 n=1 Tax=Penaeus vannamei TaxID=6689 RepID=A0A3R7MJS6_PENVA|nr:putative nephrin isoform X2 [Penaeus vannamei]
MDETVARQAYDSACPLCIPQLVDGLVEWMSVLEEPARILGLCPRPVPAAEASCAQEFTIINVTTNSATMTWSENTEGGRPIGYTLKYWKQDTPNHQFLDVVGHNKTYATVEDLAPGTEYVFTILAYSEDGRSSYSAPSTVITMAKGRESVSIREEVPEKGIRVPSFLLILLTLAGTVLVALNCVIIFCFVCRRTQHPRAAQGNQQKIQEKVFSISSSDEAAQESDPAVTSSYDVMHKMASCHAATEEYQLTSLGGDAEGRASPSVLLAAGDASLPEAAAKSCLSWRDESVIPPDVCPRNLEADEQDFASGRPYDSQSPPSRPSSPENHSDPSSQFHLSFNPSDSNSPSRVSGILLRDLAEEKLTAPLLSFTPRSHSLHHCSLAPLQHAWERHHQSHHNIPSDSDVLLLRSQLGVELTLPRSSSTAPRPAADATTSRPSTSRSPGNQGRLLPSEKFECASSDNVLARKVRR